MADEVANNSEAIFQIQRMYLKDMSLEQPNSPQILLEAEGPTVDINIGIEQAQIGEATYEVCVTGTVTAKVQDKVLFLVECKQGGRGEVRNFPADQLSSILGINCPQMIYPYVRAHISDIITRAGFPPVLLNEINFQAIYQAQLEQAAQSTQQ